MTLRAILLFLFVVSINFCYGQINKANIRPPFELKVFVTDSTVYDAPMKETQYVVHPGVLELFPGDSVLVEADTLKDSLVNVHVVSQKVNPKKTILLIFNQSRLSGNSRQMILKVVNPFDRKLAYSANILSVETKRWTTTSINPVLPNLISYELWHNAIAAILLYDFHFTQ